MMQKPHNINFGSGPCAKHKDWTPPRCKLAGRSHRSPESLSLIQQIIDLQRKILAIPDDYFVGIVSASSSGAMETLMWSLLGANGVDVISHCIFSKHWENDIVNELKISDVRVFRENFPQMADVSRIDFDRDVVFCWTSTTSGVSFRDAHWIKSDKKGLTICDAASAMFMFVMDWSKLDATAFSWQKGLGGEAGFGMIVLSPRAIARLESHKPPWPIPRLFRLANDKKVNFDIFKGCTINTPSMICIEDFYNILKWADEIGGLRELLQRVAANKSTVERWLSTQNTFKYLIKSEKIRADHIVCFDITTKKYQSLSRNDKWEFIKKMVLLCEQEKVGTDFIGHILTEPHIRIWNGPTIESSDLERFLPWLEYAQDKILTEYL